MTRTDRYEIHLEQIENLRNQALDMVTESRAYRDYGDMIEESPTRGAMADKAKVVVVDACRQHATTVREKAAALRQDGEGRPT